MYLVCVVVLVVAGLALHAAATRAQGSYESLVDGFWPATLPADQPLDHDRMSTTVALLGMRDMTVLRSAIIFIGFIVTILGCVFVLKGVEAVYNLGLEGNGARATLGTASPGLVLITAGVVLILFALREESSLELKLSGAGQTHVEPARADVAPMPSSEPTLPPINPPSDGGMP